MAGRFGGKSLEAWGIFESLAGKLGGGIVKDRSGFSVSGGFGFGGKLVGEWFGGKTRSIRAGK